VTASVALIMISTTFPPIRATLLSTLPAAVIVIATAFLPIPATLHSAFPVSVVVIGPSHLPSSTSALALVTVVVRFCRRNSNGQCEHCGSGNGTSGCFEHRS
jgi:hypothetical protein